MPGYELAESCPISLSSVGTGGPVSAACQSDVGDGHWQGFVALCGPSAIALTDLVYAVLRLFVC